MDPSAPLLFLFKKGKNNQTKKEGQKKGGGVRTSPRGDGLLTCININKGGRDLTPQDSLFFFLLT